MHANPAASAINCKHLPLAPRSKALVTYHTLQNRFDKLGYVLHGEGWSITPSHHQALPISGVRRQRRSTSTARTRRVSGIMAQCGNNSGIASQEQYVYRTNPMDHLPAESITFRTESCRGTITFLVGRSVYPGAKACRFPPQHGRTSSGVLSSIAS